VASSLEDAQILEDAAKEWFELRSYRAAAKLCEDALAIREELCDAGDPLIAKTLHILGRIYEQTNEWRIRGRPWKEHSHC